MVKDKEKKRVLDKSGLGQALSLAWSLGYTIVVPLVLLALGGRFIDKKFDTSPWFLLVGIILSVFVSTIAVYFKAIQILAEATDDKSPKQESKRTKEQF